MLPNSQVLASWLVEDGHIRDPENEIQPEHKGISGSLQSEKGGQRIYDLEWADLKWPIRLWQELVDLVRRNLQSTTIRSRILQRPSQLLLPAPARIAILYNLGHEGVSIDVHDGVEIGQLETSSPILTWRERILLELDVHLSRNSQEQDIALPAYPDVFGFDSGEELWESFFELLQQSDSGSIALAVRLSDVLMFAHRKEKLLPRFKTFDIRIKRT